MTDVVIFKKIKNTLDLSIQKYLHTSTHFLFLFRNQKYRKLKKFFGENTPSIKEGQEKALQPSSQREQFTLPDNLEVQKTGILAVKILAIEGKKSHTRSWRGMGAVLSRDMLYLLKDKKENANMVRQRTFQKKDYFSIFCYQQQNTFICTIRLWLQLTAPSGSLSIDEKPICIVACYVAIEYAYTKKRHVFKLITSTTSEYLLQAEDERDMIEWIRAIEANRHPDKEVSCVNLHSSQWKSHASATWISTNRYIIDLLMVF